MLENLFGTRKNGNFTPLNDTGIATEQHRPDPILTIRHFSYLSPETVKCLKSETNTVL